MEGMIEPLTKSNQFVSMLRKHCSKVHIRELDAGHAPHDEVPDKVNSLLIHWLVAWLYMILEFSGISN
ncbi:hypothetical protein GUJ93_ZPchr0009g1493 [Zizania palustris]|uniref:Uncharacterized protein n=1 Tax=Zizania palustris TaxID=103762 RepID=A0A8J5RRW1_ZIZPA|nr:hypothetical protein GUJ93_ZPchr0009g1493 [Zizania palustris]